MSRYEKILQSFASPTDGNASVFAESSRQTRENKAVVCSVETEIRSVCSGVAGPVLCSYVLWILSRSLEMGLKRLYFISRDGDLLLQIARRLLPAFWPGHALEIRYLHGSRQAWVLPSLLAANRDVEQYALIYFNNASLKAILSRVGLTLAEGMPVLARYGFSESDWERKLAPSEKESVKALFRDVGIQAGILKQAQQVRDSALGYFEQEGLFDDVPYGLVDLGWAGVQKGAFEGILSLRGKLAPPFFFFGRISSPCHDDQAELHAYHFNVDRSFGVDRQVPGITQVMELFCASLEGSLQRYEYKDGRYEPILREPNVTAVRAWGFEIMRESITDFANKLAENAPGIKQPVFLPPEVSDTLLKAFWRKPTLDEARVWGEFPFEEDTSGAPSQRLVPHIGPVNFWRAFWHGRGFEQYTEWSRGIVAANGPLLGLLWKACLAGYKARKKLERLMFGHEDE